MLTGLKVSTFSCKCVFYRVEHHAKERPHGIKSWRSQNAKMKCNKLED